MAAVPESDIPETLKGKPVPQADLPETEPTGGAAFGVFPKQRAVPSTPETKQAVKGMEAGARTAADVLGFIPPEKPEFDFSKVKEAGGIGAAAGAAGPALLKGAGSAIGAIPTPITKGAGAVMRGLGTAMGTVPVTKRTAAGAAGFAGAEAGGQVAGKAGLPPIVGQIGGAKVVSEIPAVLRAAGKAAIGTTQPETTKLARQAESMGFKLEPGQLRKDKPLGTPGFMEEAKAKNEQLATKLASQETGKATDSITPDFLKGRVTAIGNEYKNIFDRKLDIDTDLVKKLQEMQKFEQAVDPAGVGPVTQTARNIINRWEQESLGAQQRSIENRIKRIMQQQQEPRGGVAVMTRLKRDWPTLRDASSGNVPEWFGGVEQTVKELSDKLGLKVTPKIWVSQPRRSGLYGMATGDGNIIINDAMDYKGAVATALHEFGHQAEFQLFMDSSYDVKNAVIRAWNSQKGQIKPETTISQYRPITAAKYPEDVQKMVPEKRDVEGYFNNFAEWFAEQTSRWITTTKQPTTVVEKFFAKIADTWKKIYSTVVGHVPLTKEVDDFFRSNWKGDLLAPVNAELTGATRAAEGGAITAEDIVAKIDGAELQRLRSNLTRIARTAKDGVDRKTAGDFVTAIDEAIGRYDPALLERLRKANREYAAAIVLAEGIEKGWVSQGKVSLQGLGQHLANNTYGFGTGTSAHPLYDLGYMGQALRMRSRAEGAEFPKYDAVAALLGRGRQALGSIVGTRSQVARDVQRGLSEREQLERLQKLRQERKGQP